MGNAAAGSPLSTLLWRVVFGRKELLSSSADSGGVKGGTTDIDFCCFFDFSGWCFSGGKKLVEDRSIADCARGGISRSFFLSCLLNIDDSPLRAPVDLIEVGDEARDVLEPLASTRAKKLVGGGSRSSVDGARLPLSSEGLGSLLADWSGVF